MAQLPVGGIALAQHRRVDPDQRWKALQRHMRAARAARDAGDQAQALEQIEAALLIDPEFLAAHALRNTLSPGPSASPASNLIQPVEEAPAAVTTARAARANESLEARARRRRIDHCLSTARSAAARGQLDQAAAALAELRALDPDSAALEQLTAELAPPAPPEPPPPAVVVRPPLQSAAAGARTIHPVAARVRRPSVWPALAVTFLFLGALLGLLVLTWPPPAAPLVEPLQSRAFAEAALLVHSSTPVLDTSATSGAVTESATDEVSKTALIETLESPPVQATAHPADNGAARERTVTAAPLPGVQPPPVSAAAAERPASPPLATDRVAEPPDVVPFREPPQVAAASPNVPPTPPVPASLVDDAALIRETLHRYRRAYNGLDARLAHAVYPGVDESALARAFDSLRSQALEFDACSLETRVATARAICRGSARYVPKIGSREPRAEPRVWTFTLAKVENDWMITSARVDR